MYVHFSEFRYRWFTLCRKPNQFLSEENKNSSGYELAPVHIPHSPPAQFTSLVAVGSDIYNIGGSLIPSSPTPPVWILDCKSHTLRKGPTLRKETRSLAASVVDEKIYVARNLYRDGDYYSVKDLVEVLDTTTLNWNHVASIGRPTESVNSYSACIDGKFHVRIDRDVVVAYNSKECRWDSLIGERLGNTMFRDASYCVIDNVLYSAFEGGLRWYDMEARMCRALKVLEGLPKLSFPENVRLADHYGGKMAVLWEEVSFRGPSHKYRKMIWCLVIALKRSKSNTCEILGTIEWFDNVHTVFDQCDLVKALVVTL